MAYEKFKLNERNDYQLFQAMYLSVGLIATAENEMEGPIEIGSEILSADDWDDVAIFSWRAGVVTAEHWQIKCQHTPLDMQSLQRMLAGALNLHRNDPTRTFKIGIPGDVNICVSRSNCLSSRKLSELCERCHGPGSPHLHIASNPAKLPEKALQDWFEVIKSAAGSANTAAELLRCMSVENIGEISLIQQRTHEALRYWYSDPLVASQAIERVLRKLNPIGRVCYNDLAEELRTVPRVGTSRSWASFRYSNEGWWLRSTLESSDIVSPVWNSGGGGPELRFLTSPGTAGPLVPALLRLALHSDHGVSLKCVERDNWRDRAKQLTGGTLGNDESNHVDSIFSPGCNQSCPPPITASLGQTQLPDSLRTSLECQMHAATWTRVAYEVESKLNDLCTENALHKEAFAAWADIKRSIAPPATAGRELLCKLLHAPIEPKCIRGDIRCGPLTAETMAQVLVLIVALRVAFRQKLAIGAQGIINIQGLTVTALALKKCFDPDNQQVISILDSVSKIAFSGGVLVLGGTDTPTSDSILDLVKQEYRRSFAQSSAPPLDADAAEPDIVFSWGRDMRLALKDGKTALCKWVEERVINARKQHREALSNALNAIREEETLVA